jgi:hypothetical protein
LFIWVFTVTESCQCLLCVFVRRFIVASDVLPDSVL